MAGKMENATHQDATNFEGPVDTGNPHAKRPLDKKQGDANADIAVSSKDPGKVFDSGKVAEQISALFAGVEGLSEDFSNKATVVLEGVLSEQISNLRESIRVEYQTKLDEQIASMVESYHDKLDVYMNYVCETFMKENQVAIDQGIKNDIAEQVLESVVSIVEANGVTIPEDKVDVAEALAAEIRSLETRLNEQLELNTQLAEDVTKFKTEKVLSEMSEGLSDAGKEKLMKLTENISFKDVDDFKARVAILKETLKETVASPAATNLDEQVQVVEKTPARPNDRMTQYLAALRD